MKGNKVTKTIPPEMLGCYLGRVIKYDGIICRLIAVSVDGWVLVDYSLDCVLLRDAEMSSQKTQSQVYEMDFTGKVEIELEDFISDVNWDYKEAVDVVSSAQSGFNVFGLTEHHGVTIKK